MAWFSFCVLAFLIASKPIYYIYTISIIQLTYYCIFFVNFGVISCHGMGSIQIAELWIDTYRLCYSSIYCTTFYTHMSFKYSIYAEGSFEVMIL